MLEFETRSLRFNDEEGHLSAAGAQWNEARIFVWIPCLVVSAFGFFATLFCLAEYAQSRNGDDVWWSALLVCGGITIGAAWLWRRFGNSTSAVIFHANGYIEMPYGRPFHWRKKHVDGHHENIVSIETQRSERPENMRFGDYEVCMFAADGDTIYVAINLDRQEAHKIAVLLNHALRHLRDSLANASYRRVA